MKLFKVFSCACLVAISLAITPDKDFIELLCPKNHQASYLSYIYNNPEKGVMDICKYSICLRCQPEQRASNKWIEICHCGQELFSNDPINNGSIFCTKQKSPYKICQTPGPSCGLKVPTNISQLQLLLQNSEPLPCSNQSARLDASKTSKDINKISEDISKTAVAINEQNATEMKCPENWKVVALKSFTFAFEEVPNLAIICRPNYISLLKDNSTLFMVYAKQPFETYSIEKLVPKSIVLPVGSKFGHSRLFMLQKEPQPYCGLYWNTNHEPSITITRCPGYIEVNVTALLIFGAFCTICLILTVTIVVFIFNFSRSDMMLELDKHRTSSPRNPEDLIYEDVSAFDTVGSDRTNSNTGAYFIPTSSNVSSTDFDRTGGRLEAYHYSDLSSRASSQVPLHSSDNEAYMKICFYVR